MLHIGAKLPLLRLTAMAGLVAVLGGCRGLVASDPAPNAPAGLKNINHIILISQENRGFDHYFGALRQYWAANGFPDQSFDGLPQFNPDSGAQPLKGPVPA